jgi:hypothetical protein
MYGLSNISYQQHNVNEKKNAVIQRLKKHSLFKIGPVMYMYLIHLEAKYTELLRFEKSKKIAQNSDRFFLNFVPQITTFQ